MELDFTNETVEKLLFKKLLVDKGWLNIVSKTYDERWFRTKHIGTLIKLVLKYYDKYQSIPNTKVIDAMIRKFAEKHPSEIDVTEACSLISDISKLELNANEDVINANIKEFIRKKAFISTLNDNIETLSFVDESDKNSEKYQQLIDKVLTDFDKVQKITFNDTDLGLNYFDEKSMESHWDFLKNPDAKISTGWDSVDHYTNGGFLKSGRMLGLFMAQAGLGKSVFLSNLAVNFLKQNLSVVVISLEMSQDVYAQRFDAHISLKNINKLAENEKTAKERILEFYKKYPESNLVIKEFPPRSVTTRDIQVYLENLKSAGHKIDVLIVDYLNLVLPVKRTDSMFKDGMAVSEELRGLSYTLNAPVISAVQSNSEGMNTEEIDMQNVSESRGIVHTADTLFAIYQTKEQREAGQLGFKVIKNRLGGRVGTKSTFIMNPETLCLTDVTFDKNVIEDSEQDSSEFSKIMQNMPDIAVDISNI